MTKCSNCDEIIASQATFWTCDLCKTTKCIHCHPTNEGEYTDLDPKGEGYTVCPDCLYGLAIEGLKHRTKQ